MPDLIWNSFLRECFIDGRLSPGWCNLTKFFEEDDLEYIRMLEMLWGKKKIKPNEWHEIDGKWKMIEDLITTGRT